MTNNVTEYHKHDMNETTTIMKQCIDPRLHINTSNKFKNTNSQTMNNHQVKVNPWTSMTLFKNIMTIIHSQKQEKQTQNMENEVRQRKPITFSWRLKKKWCRNGVWGVFGSVSAEKEIGKIVNSHKKSREKLKKKSKETVFETQKHAFFTTETSRQGKLPKLLKSKLWKIF